ncbi:Na/Pi cotransporter family protein [Bdellovibrio bacteriovorus]|uniref:Na/Pi-cotransporter family protein n=1 Tax=Bdellovibrio bacteriovorus TaxID=959 RepID=A0A150WDJ4_BDEBC|nr:Na/Pi cotransporter family protein [Bdellovibrio bacteriovorus]KYG61056.1 Na/Pi-cotransporter family protein [Bdellovibrio bacteriovorus]
MIDTHNSYFIILISGVALFLYGMGLASSSLEKLMAGKITILLNRLSQSKFLAILTGVVLTTLMQSSGAVTSMLVGLGSARVINLRQVMGVIIGTAIGTTLTVQFISLDLGSYALPVFAIAFAFYFKSKKTVFKNLSLVFMGFGLLFFGLNLISVSSHHFAENPLLTDLFQNVRDNPGYSLLISIVFCAFVQSSAVTIGLAMSLAAVKAITFYDAMIWVYGANIGTTSVALIAAAGGNYIGRQVAWAHFFYKTISVVIFYPFTQLFIDFLNTFDTTTSRQIANAHLIFNILSAVIFYPFINKGAELIEKMFPKQASEEFGTEFVKLDNYQSSALAVSYANREIMRTADIVLGMIKDSIRLFETNDPKDFDSIKDRDNKVDFLYRETKMFLLDHANKSNTVVHQNVMNMIMFLSDLERAADAIDINILALAIKKNALKLEFSTEGWSEICQMHQQVVKVAAMAINAYQNKELSEEAIQLKRDLAKTEITLRENHISRLNRGMNSSINTSSIHLDLLSEYRRIASLLCNHAYNQRSS